VGKTLRGQHPKGRNIVSQKSPLVWVQIHMSYFLVRKTKFAVLLSPIAEGKVLDKIVFLWDILTRSGDIRVHRR